MGDPDTVWTLAPDWSTARLVAHDWQARCVAGLHQILLSGGLDRASTALAPGAPEVGLWHVAGALPYLVRIARDRAMLVSDRQVGAPDGWNADGWAASDVSDGWLVLELSGSAVEEVVRESTAADLRSGSRSAATRFAGVAGVLVYRTAEQTVRLHAERSFAPYLWRWLETRRS